MTVRGRGRGPALQRPAIALAETAFSLVEADATGAAELAARALAIARGRREPAAQVAALHALAYARHELGDPRSLRTARMAVRVAERHGLTERAALARRRLAIDLAGRGDIGAATRELDAACAALGEHELARSQVFRLAMHVRSGRPLQSLEASERALSILRRHGDAVWQARLLHNRGLLLAERGDVARAESDLARARDLFARTGGHGAAADVEIELARVALARGDLPSCLAQLDAVEPAGVSPGALADLQMLRARTLAAAHLADEALAALAEAQAIWRSGRVVDHEGRLEAVRLTLLADDPRRARRRAAAARVWFERHDSPTHAARADGLALAAAIAGATVTRDAVAAGRRAADTLGAEGWREEALRIRVAVARGEFELGAVDTARAELRSCASLRRRGPIADRIEAWHVEALLRRDCGDGAGAQRAVRAGLALLDRHRAALGSSDLRASASALGVQLSRVGLTIALAGSRIETMLAWSERTRANALRLDPITPPAGPTLDDRHHELRRVVAEIQAGGSGDGALAALVARRTALESEIRRLARHAAGDTTTVRPLMGRRALAAALGDRALLELVELGGQLSAITLVGGRLAYRALGPVAPITEQVGWLRFALSRLARLPPTAAQRESLTEGARDSAAELDRALLAPLASALGDRELVIVSTGSLHTLPWPALPSLGGRALAMAPSAATWASISPTHPRDRDGATVLVAGPGLRHAADELQAVARSHRNAVLLSGGGATVAAVMDRLEGAEVAHLACHGRFRADGPLFSSLELADGPLNVYELQRLTRPPRLVVLSACDLALSESRPGDELLGFAVALLAMGTETVLASCVPVPDAAARHLMTALHELLAAGHRPATALAIAQRRLAGGEMALGGFVCLGRG